MKHFYVLIYIFFVTPVIPTICCMVESLVLTARGQYCTIKELFIYLVFIHILYVKLHPATTEPFL